MAAPRGEKDAPSTGSNRMPARMPRLRDRLKSSSQWIRSLDGCLLSDDSWRRRHLAICALLTVNALVVAPWSILAPHGTGLWPELAALAASLAVAWFGGLERRPRELGVVAGLLLCAAIQNRYIANLSSVAAAYVVLLAIYQDWLPVAVGVAGTLILPILAVADPQALNQWRAFEREAPLTGALARFLGVCLAASAVLLVWRANGAASRDMLTGLATRELAERRLGLALNEGRRPAALICDVDAFRLAANDLPRHRSNELIRRVGRRLSRAASEMDLVVAAGGGAKYLVVCTSDRSETEVRELGRRLREAVTRAPFLIGGDAIPLTVSVGMAIARQADDAGDLLRAADMAMLRAKGRGEAAIVLAERDLEDPGRRTAAPITAELRRAVERQELCMHYQPIVQLRSGVIVGAEALVRWKHPERGLLPPGTFLPVAEMHPGLSAAIGNAIFEMVLEQTARWQREFPGSLPAGVAVNVSPRRLMDPALTDRFRATLLASEVEARRLVVELTEDAVMDLEVNVPAVLGEISGLGVQIAIDDFGTGHSSLAHLRDFPLHEIKLDRSFVSRIVDSRGDRAVMRAVMAIAHEFEKVLVLEGVETIAQRQALTTVVDALPGGAKEILAQGFLFARPMPGEEFDELLRRGVSLPVRAGALGPVG